MNFDLTEEQQQIRTTLAEFDEREIKAGVGEGERGPGVGAVTATFHGLIFLGQDALDVAKSALPEPGGHGLVPPLVVLHAGE